MGLMDRFLNLIGFEEVPEAEAESLAVEEAVPDGNGHLRGELGAVQMGPRKRGTLVSLPGSRQVRVVVVEPRTFDEVQAVADHLKGKRPVILNLESIEKETAQKFLDFLSGTIYALDGTMQKVGTAIFLFAPSNVEVAGQIEGPSRDRAVWVER